VEFFLDDQVLNFRRLIDTKLKHKADICRSQDVGAGGPYEKAVQQYALTPAKSRTVMR
jgi:hypothetical protein